MKQGNIIRACKALDKLMAQDTTLAVSKKIFDMRTALQPAWDFQVNEETKIAERHPNVDPQTVSVKYETGNSEQEQERRIELDSYCKEMKELSEMDQLLTIEAFTIPVDSENIKIAGSDIKALQGFITFE